MYVILMNNDIDCDWNAYWIYSITHSVKKRKTFKFHYFCRTVPIKKQDASSSSDDSSSDDDEVTLKKAPAEKAAAVKVAETFAKTFCSQDPNLKFLFKYRTTHRGDKTMSNSKS